MPRNRRNKRHSHLIGWVSAIALLLGGGGTTLLFTQGMQCTGFSFSPNSVGFDYNANASSVTCTKFPVGNSPYTGCPWVATSNASWITLTGNSASNQQGVGTVPYSVAENPEGISRSGTITFDSGNYNSATFTVNQNANPFPVLCTSFGVAPGTGSNYYFDGGTTNVSFSITASPANCYWTASGSSLITSILPSQGVGSSNIEAFFPVNNTTTRQIQTITVTSGSASIILYGQQNPSSCQLTPSPANLSFPPAGGTLPMTVTSNLAVCYWQLTSNASWLQNTPTGSVLGTQPVSVTAGADSAGSRSSSLTSYGLVSNISIPMDQVGAAQDVITEYPVPTRSSEPDGITAGPDGALWFTEAAGNKIGRITTSGSVTEFTIPTANSSPIGITTGPDSALWFTENVSSKIGRLTTSGVFSEFTIPTANSEPFSIAAGSDGALWFTENNSNKIGQITTFGTFNEYTVPTAGSRPGQITAGPDGALWFTELDGNNIGRIATWGAISEYGIPTTNSAPDGITTGPDGALWFTEEAGNKIGRVTTSGTISEFDVSSAGSQLLGIVAGTDGALWFAGGEGNIIGRITPSGTFTTYPPPNLDGWPWGIAAGPDGAVWFTELMGNNIGRIAPGPPTLVLSTNTVLGQGFVGKTANLPTVNLTSSNSLIPVTFTYSYQVTSIGPGWLSVVEQTSGPSGQTPASLIIGANLAGLAPGNYNGTITVTPSNGPPQVINVHLTAVGTDFLQISYSPAVNQALQLSTAGSTTGSITVTSTDTSVPGLYFYAIDAVTTPPGGTWLSIPANESGTTNAQFNVSAARGSLPNGTYSGSVTLIDTAGGQHIVPVTFYVTTPLTVTCNPNPLGLQGTLEVGVPFSTTCQASGAVPPYNWSLGIPRFGSAGGSFSSTTGSSITYSGTPTASGSYSFPIVVGDNSSQTASATFSGTIDPALQIESLLPISSAVAGFPYGPVSFASVSGGRGAGTYFWSSGAISLPSGLGMNSSTGAIGGTPALGTDGSYALGYSVTDGLGTITGSYPVGSLVILAPPTLGASSNSSGNGGPPGTANLDLTPTAIDLTSSNQAPITFTVTSQTNNTLGGNWLTVNTSSLTTSQSNPATLTASANLVGLAAGLYTGSVTVSPTSLHSGGAKVIQLSATVFAGDALQIAKTPLVGQLLQVTSATPTTGTITVTASPAAPLYFSTASSMTTQPAAKWMSIDPNGPTTDVGAQVETNTAVTVNFKPGTLPPGPYDGVVTIYDTLQNQYPVPVRLVVPYPPVKITGPAALPGGTVGSLYPNTTMTVTGGNNSYTWSASGLPNGLSINASTGVIGGTPSVSYSGNVTISVADGESPAMTDSKTYSLTVVYPPIGVSGPASLPGGTVHSVYQSTTMSATGGNGTYNWTASGLPNGLSISNGGVISGTPNVSFNGNVTITVADSESPAMSIGKTYSLTIVYPPLSVSGPASVPGGTVGIAYQSTNLAATGGNGTYNWSAPAPGLPANLSLSAAGVISGTPNVSFNGNITVKVSDTELPAMTATKTYSLTIVYPPLSVAGPPSLPAGTVGSVYQNTTLTATGGNGNYNWSAPAPGLPNGLSISNGGVISGTPKTGFIGAVTLMVSDTELPAMTATKIYVLSISYPPLSIGGSTSLPGGIVGSAYQNTTFSATGGNGTYNWSAPAPGLPSGLSISNGGVISGTPQIGFNGNVTLMVSDTESPSSFATKSYSLTIVYPQLRITGPQSIPNGTVTSAYQNTTMSAAGGNGTYRWSASGLPGGLGISEAGVISGTPNTSFSGSVSITVSDTESTAMTATQSYSLTVVYPQLILTSPQSLPGGTVGLVYQTITAAATGGNGTYNWSAPAPGLPNGLSISNGGVISGTPNAAFSGSVTLKVSDTESPAMTAETSYALTIYPALTITSPNALPAGTATAQYPATAMTATGGTGAGTYTWSVQAPGLPNGLKISNGVISGTPNVAFNGNVIVVVTDRESPPVSTTESFPLTINPQLVISGPPSLPGAVVNVAYLTPTMTTTGGTPPFIWSATGLPVGLRIDRATGNITGIPPTDDGSPFSPQITVQDAAMASAAKTYNSVSVGPGPPTVCQVTHTESTGVVDIQTMIQEALGVVPAADILNSGGVANVVGVQVVVEAAVGFGCLTTGTSSMSISVAPSAVSEVRTAPMGGTGLLAPADLGTLGGSSTVAFAINGLGQVVGSSAAHAFLWEAGRMTDVSLPLANAATSVAYGVNGAGQVVGTYSSGGGESAGFFSDRGITFGIAGETARAINESGQVVGSSLADGAFNHAFLWDGGITTDLGTLGGSESQGCCVNNTGLIAGSSQVEGDSAVHAFRYDGATMTDLGTLGGTESVAAGINDAGQIVGYSTTSGNDSRHAFLYAGGLMLDLGTLGGARSQADGINQAGLIVGWAETADGVRHACLWSAGKIIDLTGAATVGLVEATAINDAGQIVANGANGRAYLIALPARL